MVKVLDNWYFQELGPDELRAAVDKAFVVVEGIHNLDDISRFVASH